jgi:dynein heavy chain
LTTLERQFKNISRGELAVIEETLPSLLNGLKLIWTISRHISQNLNKMEDLLESISNEICDKVRCQIDIRRIFRSKQDQAITTINQGINVLDKWQKHFNDTKMQIELEATVNRWDFSKAKEIFIKPRHMKSILEDMRQVCTTLKEFYSLLGPDLKAVTGDADSIDEQKNKIVTEVAKLESFVYDVFAPEHHEEWKELYKAFEDAMRQSDGSCVHLIDSSFNKLKSSEGAFDLLNKFKNIKTRKAIEEQLANKYIDVLNGYRNEVAQME